MLWFPSLQSWASVAWSHDQIIVTYYLQPQSSSIFAGIHYNKSKWQYKILLYISQKIKAPKADQIWVDL
jgi:hypothetical protein